MRISDWSSDVCSSDLGAVDAGEIFELAAARFLVEPLHIARLGDLDRRIDEDFDELAVRDHRAHHFTFNTKRRDERGQHDQPRIGHQLGRSEEHTSELQSLMRISYAVFCLKQKTYTTQLTLKTYATINTDK